MRFGVCDIENSKNGDVTEIGCCLNDTEPCIFHGRNAWDDAFNYMVSTGVTRWYAHNGGGWDWLSLVHHSYYDPGGWQFTSPVTANCVGTRPILIRFEKIELCDSWCLTQCSLDKFASEMETHPKQKVDKLPWDMTKAERVDYLIDDCLALRDGLNRFIGLLQDEGYSRDKPPLTIAGAAWNIWRENYSPNTYERLSHEADLFCRQGYKGGRVEVFKPGDHKQVNVYDVNSMYPYVMLDEDYPIGEPRHVDELCVSSPGAYRIEYANDPARVMQFKPVEGDVLYSPEIFRIMRTGGNVKVYSGLVFNKCSPLFRDYVERFYSLKQHGGPLGFVAKMLLNHLYGKFGSRPISSSMETMSEQRLAETLAKGYDLSPLTVASDQADWWVVDRPTPWRREHVAVAGLVTSYARNHLHRLIDQQTIYSDTDSIHTCGKMDCSDGLGGVKLEYGPADGVYLGRKCYALKDGIGDEKIRLKGISQKTLTRPLTYDDVVTFINDPRQLVSLRPATLKETLAGIQPCSMVSTDEGGHARERKRTLRVTA